MTRKCFFVPEIPPEAGIFDLPRQVSRQLESVLRAKVGDYVELLDGVGEAWTCEISGIRKGIVSVRLTGKRDRSLFESPFQITLGLGIARSDIMDQVVRQATEMGVSRLVAFRASRSQYGLSGKQAEKKKVRWSKIAGEAICQCGRTIAPEIEICEGLEAFLASVASKTGADAHVIKIFARERESGEGLADLRRGTGMSSAIFAVVGPEGGWDSSEVSSLMSAGFRPVSLGPRILRFETAAVALVSSIQLLWGDIGGNTGRAED